MKSFRQPHSWSVVSSTDAHGKRSIAFWHETNAPIDRKRPLRPRLAGQGDPPKRLHVRFAPEDLSGFHPVVQTTATTQRKPLRQSKVPTALEALRQITIP
jgi:hypothetical protein